VAVLCRAKFSYDHSASGRAGICIRGVCLRLVEYLLRLAYIRERLRILCGYRIRIILLVYLALVLDRTLVEPTDVAGPHNAAFETWGPSLHGLLRGYRPRGVRPSHSGLFGCRRCALGGLLLNILLLRRNRLLRLVIADNLLLASDQLLIVKRGAWNCGRNTWGKDGTSDISRPRQTSQEWVLNLTHAATGISELRQPALGGIQRRGSLHLSRRCR
jgi:hypothetical protein